MPLIVKTAAMDLPHMRRFAISAGRPGGLITEITWKAGNVEVICEWCYRTKDEKLYTLILTSLFSTGDDRVLYAISCTDGMVPRLCRLVSGYTLCCDVRSQLAIDGHQHQDKDHHPAFCRFLLSWQGAGEVHINIIYFDSSVIDHCRRNV